jgi:hypothetical protein
MPCRNWAALHSWTLLCPFLGLLSSHIWSARPKLCIFTTWSLKFNIPKTQRLTNCRGNCCCAAFFLICITSLWFWCQVFFCLSKKIVSLQLWTYL